MKLAIVSNIPAKYRIDLYRHIDERNGAVYFYKRNHRLLNYCAYSHGLPFRYLDVTLFTLPLSLFRDKPKTVVCINASPYTFLCGCYALLKGARFVVWWAGTPLSERGASVWRRLFRRMVFTMADEFLCYSEHAEAYLVQEYGVSRDAITVLGNVTMNPAAFGAGDRATRASEPDRPVRLLAVGSLIARKNYGFLLQVFARLSARVGTPLELHFVGDGPERMNLEEQARAAGLSGVHFYGELKDQRIVEAYRDADIFVHAATMDQWPQVVNEAMSASLPVVVSDQSGVSETLFDVGRELYVVPLQVERYVEVLERLVGDAALRAEVGANGRIAVERLYKRAFDIFEKYVAADENSARP